MAPAWLPRFELDQKISVIALITFVMSAASLIWQGVNSWQGATVRMINPDQIEIGSTEAFALKSRDDGSYANFIVAAIYVNESAGGYNETILRERLTIRFKDGPEIEHRNYWSVTSDLDLKDRNVIKLTKVKDALPFHLLAGTSESHDTLFQPWPKLCAPGDAKCSARDNYMTWPAFVALLTAKHEIEFIVTGDTASGKTVIAARCTVKIDGRALANLIAKGWGSPVCLNATP